MFRQPRFTIEHFMLVVVVVGILAAIALPNYVALSHRRAVNGVVKQVWPGETGMVFRLQGEDRIFILPDSMRLREGDRVRVWPIKPEYSDREGPRPWRAGVTVLR